MTMTGHLSLLHILAFYAHFQYQPIRTTILDSQSTLNNMISDSKILTLL